MSSVVGEHRVVVREVWEKNLVYELTLIRRCLPGFPFVSLDTEFPGTIITTNLPKYIYSSLPVSHLYSIIKQNVDALKLIQLGLTLCDARGNLPSFDAQSFVWQFNFRDFNPNTDPHDPAAISLLRAQGIDFERNRVDGIHSRRFAIWFNALVLNVKYSYLEPTWITFTGLMDIGLLIKILMGCNLPDSFQEFDKLMQLWLGNRVYDLKYIAREQGFHGSLEKIAKLLGRERMAGKSHQAGSDSLLTMQVFKELVLLNNNVYLVIPTPTF